MNLKIYYEKLELMDNASTDDIKKAYKKMAIKYHPDKQAGKTQEEINYAEEKFKEIGEAYEILTNKDKYLQQSFNNVNISRGFINPHEIFNQLFKEMNIVNMGHPLNSGQNISIVMPGNHRNNCVMRSSSISIQNGKRVETIQETINGVTKQRVVISNLN